MEELLAGAVWHREPFPHMSCEAALPQPLLAWLDAQYDRPLAWQHHHDSFYRAWLCDVSEGLDPRLRRALAARMAALTGQPLTGDVQLTVQRMEPGQYALPHTDRPLAGYESARLVVQLTRSWREDHGGQLRLHPDPNGRETTCQRAPLRNTAFGFVTSPRSVHSVAPVRRQRRTAVFNFWHAANTPDLARLVRAQLAGMRFDALPPALEALALEAEISRPEAHSFRAGAVAWLLARWGAGESAVIEGYRRGLEPLTGPGDPPRILLARWIQHLHFEGFDAELWGALFGALHGLVDARLQPILALAFPAVEAGPADGAPDRELGALDIERASGAT